MKAFLENATDPGHERSLLRAAELLDRLETGKLAVGARAALDDSSGVRHLRHAAEIGRVLRDELEQFLEQDGEGDNRAFAKIDHALLDAVALRAPAVFTHEEGWVIAPALVLPPQAIEQPQDAAEKRSDGDAILDERANVGDAHLKGREAR